MKSRPVGRGGAAGLYLAEGGSDRRDSLAVAPLSIYATRELDDEGVTNQA